jgi:hypothetical protein
MTHLKNFTSSLMGLPEINVTMERWIYGTKEMERKISQRTIYLCRYFDRIPKQSLSGYIDALLEALDSEELESGFLKSEHLDGSIRNFIDYLKSLDDPSKVEKAELILAKVREELQIDE